jgi:hypothetical protein
VRPDSAWATVSSAVSLSLSVIPLDFAKLIIFSTIPFFDSGIGLETLEDALLVGLGGVEAAPAAPAP